MEKAAARNNGKIPGYYIKYLYKTNSIIYDSHALAIYKLLLLFIIRKNIPK